MAPSKDIIRRVLVQFDADAANLVKAQEEIEAGNKAMVDQFGATAAAAHKAFDTIGLGAQNQVSKVTKLSNAFQGFTSTLTNGIGAGLGAIDNFSKKLAPWNQALELGGKAVKFLGDGLDEYAKKSPEAKQQVEDLTKSFSNLKHEALAWVGEMTVALVGTHGLFEELDKFTKYGVGGGIGAFRSAIDEYQSENARAGRGIDFVFGGGIQKSFAETFRNDWYTGPTPDELLGKVGEKMEKYRESQKKAADEAKRWRAELAATTNADAFNRARSAVRGVQDRIRKASERGYEDMTWRTGQVDPASEWGGMDVGGRSGYADALGRLPKGAAEQKQQERSRFLESTFGPIEEFNAYATAFGTLNTAVQSSMQAWISGSMSLGLAIKKGIADALGSLASQLAVESLKHGAYALGSLAFHDYAGAAKHGMAAGAFGVGAAAAAAAAKKLGGSVAAAQASAAGGSAGASAGGSATGSGGASSSTGGGSGETPTSVQNVFIGDFFNGDERRRRQLIEEALEQAKRGGKE